MSPEQRLDQVFLQLDFAIKLKSYFELGHVNKDLFDCRVVVNLERGDSFTIPEARFHTYGDLILSSQNVFSITLGATAVALETTLQDFGIPNDVANTTSQGQLRSLVYLIRCAFAHDMMTPKWSVFPKYRREYELQLNIGTERIDLREAHNKPFTLESIGGYRVYFGIRDEVRRLISPI